MKKKKKKTLEDIAEVPARDISKGVHYPSDMLPMNIYYTLLPLVECMDLKPRGGTRNTPPCGTIL